MTNEEKKKFIEGLNDDQFVNYNLILLNWYLEREPYYNAKLNILFYGSQFIKNLIPLSEIKYLDVKNYDIKYLALAYIIIKDRLTLIDEWDDFENTVIRDTKSYLKNLEFAKSGNENITKLYNDLKLLDESKIDSLFNSSILLDNSKIISDEDLDIIDKFCKDLKDTNSI